MLRRDRACRPARRISPLRCKDKGLLAGVLNGRPSAITVVSVSRRPGPHRRAAPTSAAFGGICGCSTRWSGSPRHSRRDRPSRPISLGDNAAGLAGYVVHHHVQPVTGHAERCDVRRIGRHRQQALLRRPVPPAGRDAHQRHNGAQPTRLAGHPGAVSKDEGERVDVAAQERIAAGGDAVFGGAIRSDDALRPRVGAALCGILWGTQKPFPMREGRLCGGD